MENVNTVETVHVQAPLEKAIQTDMRVTDAIVASVQTFAGQCANLGYTRILISLLPIASIPEGLTLNRDVLSLDNRSLAMRIQSALAQSGFAYTELHEAEKGGAYGDRFGISIKVPDVEFTQTERTAQNQADTLFRQLCSTGHVKISMIKPAATSLLANEELLAAYGREGRIVNARLCVDKADMSWLVTQRLVSSIQKKFASDPSHAWRITGKMAELQRFKVAPSAFKRWRLSRHGWKVSTPTKNDSKPGCC